MTNKSSGEIKLVWVHEGGSQFEHICPDSVIAGKLYNLRCQDEHVVQVELLYNEIVIIYWSKQ